MRLPAAVSRRSRRTVKRWRWRATSRLGLHRYTWAALEGMDRRLVALYHGRHGGTFVELGANDGLQQSNTLALEVLHGWRGLLVEADPQLAAECRRNRPGSVVVCAAAAATWGTTHLQPDDLLGEVVEESTSSGESVLVLAAPLSELVDGAHLDAEIDLLSLDVEGHELEVLAGLDLTRHRPRHLLVETAQPEAVLGALGPGYERTAAWSHHDHLFTRVDDAART